MEEQDQVDRQCDHKFEGTRCPMPSEMGMDIDQNGNWSEDKMHKFCGMHGRQAETKLFERIRDDPQGSL